jgi:hypothetical protein
MTIYVVEYKADTDVPFYPVDGDANSHIIHSFTHYCDAKKYMEHCKKKVLKSYPNNNWKWTIAKYERKKVKQ